MSEEKFILAAQCNSTQIAVDRMGLAGVLEAIRQAVETAQLDILILGGEEIPDLYRAATDQRIARFVFLWYAVLSDNPGLKPEHQVVNHLGSRSAGWGNAKTRAEIGENFSFACPNHPEVQRSVLARLERLLTEYPFDGVFLDKIRFPSPANGLDDILSCFCPYCRDLAAGEGLDLEKILALLHRVSSGEKSIRTTDKVRWSQQDWLKALIDGLPLADQELLYQFLGFRARSITRLVKQIQELTSQKGVKQALDLFSPCLAYLVGQDYSSLAGLAQWVKPMVYRYANGPAGLRLEVPQLVRGLAEFLNAKNIGDAETWMQAQIPEMAGCSLEDIERDGAPPGLIQAETKKAVQWMEIRPVYLGIEAVSIPAFHINITPGYVHEMVTLARESGANGGVLSWDLLFFTCQWRICWQPARSNQFKGCRNRLLFYESILKN